jgi:hypothetical protein
VSSSDDLKVANATHRVAVGATAAAATVPLAPRIFSAFLPLTMWRVTSGSRG